MPPRVSQAQLENAVGGADKLLQLADRNRSGNITSPVSPAFIQDVLVDGNGEVNAYISLAVDISDPSLQTAPLLVRYETAIDCYLAWFRGTGGIAVPPLIAAEYERIMGELQKIADRKKGIGLQSLPASSQPIQQVTKSDAEDWVSPSSPRRRFDGFS